MTRLTVDDALRKELEQLGGCAELCDSAGRTVGFFTPASASWPESLDPDITDEELKRRAAEETFSTAEIKAHLERL